MDADQYKTSWWKWWGSEQPTWRLRTESGELSHGGSGDSSNMRRYGQNGLIEFIMTLGWWGLAIEKNGGELADWLKALADVMWMIRC